MRFYWLLTLALIMASCGPDGGRFRIEGKFKNLNQGEFYIYSHEGVTNGMDTIPISRGKFAYETDLESPVTFVFMFSNYSENVIFGEPGATVTIKGDAYNLKEMEIKGTKDNELMTAFRLRANSLSPPEVCDLVEEFVRKYPKSSVCLYIIDKYFLRSSEPDYHRAYDLVSVMLEADEGNVKAVSLAHRLEGLMPSDIGQSMPSFTAVDVNGDSVCSDTLCRRVNIIHLFATWNADSRSMLSGIRALHEAHGDSVSVVTVCLDARRADCLKTVRRDSIPWPVICDGLMWDSPLLDTLGLAVVPGNVVYDDSCRVVARNLTMPKLREKVTGMLKAKADR